MSSDSVPVLQPPAQLTAQSVPLFARVTDAYRGGEQGGVVLDLREMDTITSAGLGHLVSLGRGLSENGAVLALAGANRMVLKVLRTVGLDRLMPHFATPEEAAAWIAARGRGGND